MRRKLAAAALALAACSNTTAQISSGEINAPIGLATTSAGDRDLLFIANSGKDGLIALQLCNGPTLLDGGVDPADTCKPEENAQFIPGPIRVVPATIETSDGKRLRANMHTGGRRRNSLRLLLPHHSMHADGRAD